MKSTDSEPQGGGMELEQYRTSLEQMVEEKSKDLIAIQENLEATNRRQALFIKVLQILQLEPDIPTAMNMALAEIGRYTGVDRLATWENHLDGVTYGCTNEWCNDGIEPAIDYLRSMTIEAGSPQAMADGILKFAQMDPAEYENYCHNATETVKEYDFGYLTDRLEEILKKEVEEK